MKISVTLNDRIKEAANSVDKNLAFMPSRNFLIGCHFPVSTSD